MFYITALNDANRHQFEKLVSPQLHPLLEPTHSSSDKIVLGVESEDRLIGISILVPVDEHGQRYTIECLWVLQKYQQLGIAKMLLVENEYILRARGVTHVAMVVHLPYRLQETQNMLDLFKALGWDEIRLRYTAFYSRGENIAQERWFRLQVPDGYELFLWQDLKPHEKMALQTQQPVGEQDSREYLDPFEIAPYDPHTSLGMRYQASGRVVGWMINEVKTPKLLCFRRLFIIPEVRNRKLFYPLLANSIQRFLQYYPQGTFNVAAENHKMKATIVRMMGHRCEAILENYYCQKVFRPENSV